MLATTQQPRGRAVNTTTHADPHGALPYFGSPAAAGGEVETRAPQPRVQPPHDQSHKRRDSAPPEAVGARTVTPSHGDTRSEVNYPYATGQSRVGLVSPQLNALHRSLSTPVPQPLPSGGSPAVGAGVTSPGAQLLSSFMQTPYVGGPSFEQYARDAAGRLPAEFPFTNRELFAALSLAPKEEAKPRSVVKHDAEGAAKQRVNTDRIIACMKRAFSSISVTSARTTIQQLDPTADFTAKSTLAFDGRRATHQDDVGGGVGCCGDAAVDVAADSAIVAPAAVPSSRTALSVRGHGMRSAPDVPMLTSPSRPLALQSPASTPGAGAPSAVRPGAAVSAPQDDTDDDDEDDGGDYVSHVPGVARQGARTAEPGVRTDIGRPPTTAGQANSVLSASRFGTLSLDPFRTAEDPQAGHTVPFMFTDFAPMCFRHIRHFFGIENKSFYNVLCESKWHSIPTPGKSSAQLFFCGQNWVIKTMTGEESDFLRAILHRYYNHVRDNPHTLLPHFVGHHRLTFKDVDGNSQTLTVVVMQNVFATPNKVHEKFDLKGSTVGRFAKPEERRKLTCTKKDLDICEPLRVGHMRRAILLDQMHRDCEFLRRCSIMDYSFLIGVHRRLPASAAPLNSPPAPSAEGMSERVLTADEGGMMSIGGGEIYYCGIIDILQEYNLWKRSETFVRGVQYDRRHISSVEPREYADRFENFMAGIIV